MSKNKNKNKTIAGKNLYPVTVCEIMFHVYTAYTVHMYSSAHFMNSLLQYFQHISLNLDNPLYYFLR